MKAIINLIKADMPVGQNVKNDRNIHLEQLTVNNDDGWRLSESNYDFRAVRYSIVFAVVDIEDNDRPSMFFSKVLLCDTVKILRGFGCQVY